MTDKLKIPAHVFYSRNWIQKKTHPNGYVQAAVSNREAARKHNVRRTNRVPCGGTWQQWPNPDKPHQSKSERAFFIDSFDCLGLREVGDAHDIISLSHTGWYCDVWRDGLIRGCVFQLPSRDGTPIYIPATYCTDWDGVTLYPLDWYDEKEDAARAANSIAERDSEESREASLQDLVEQRIQSAREEIDEARAWHTKLVGALRATHDNATDPAIDILRAETVSGMRRARETVSDTVSRIRRYIDEPCTADPAYPG